MWRADDAHYSMDTTDGQRKSEMHSLSFKGLELDGKTVCSPITRRAWDGPIVEMEVSMHFGSVPIVSLEECIQSVQAQRKQREMED
jgi:hypothetical protein